MIIQLSDANGLLIYDMSNPGSLDFRGYFPIQGYINSIRENTRDGTSRLYLACGLYGVLTIDA